MADREDLQAAVRSQLGAVESVMPRSRRELRWFFGVSITAGVCEEVLYRGFLVAALTPALGLPGAAVASTAAFGYAHIYQDGAVGFVRTGLVGAGLMGLTLMAGSIWPAVLLYAVVDIAGGYAGYYSLRSQDGLNLDSTPAAA
ncbi:MAG: CPBP family intramembrane glutamic endopeptidase [Acidobacteriota bacterium]